MSTVDTIRARKTTKVLSDEELTPEDLGETLDRLVEAAGWAPFHRACDATHREHDLCGIQPWRMYVLSGPECRELGRRMPTERAGKLPRMLASADTLIQTTWLPNPAQSPLAEGQLFEPTLANMEHIAAASAAIQNLLLAATEAGLPNYWSSGGALLREAEAYSWLGIPKTEILLGSLFLFPADPARHGTTTEVVGSKLRDQRSPVGSWSRRVVLSDAED